MSWLYNKVKQFFGGREDSEEEESGSEQSYPSSRGNTVPPTRTAVTQPVIEEVVGAGGVQGLTWYLDNQRCDEDGDLADAGGFWVEDKGRVLRRPGSTPGQRPMLTRIHRGNLCLSLPMASGGKSSRGSQDGSAHNQWRSQRQRTSGPGRVP